LNELRGNVQEILSPIRYEKLIACALKLEEVDDIKTLVSLLTPERF
jgi:hypothetical protein